MPEVFPATRAWQPISNCWRPLGGTRLGFWLGTAGARARERTFTLRMRGLPFACSAPECGNISRAIDVFGVPARSGLALLHARAHLAQFFTHLLGRWRSEEIGRAHV